jgi:hypothetical protein
MADRLQKNMLGQIVGFFLFTSKLQNLLTTSLSFASSLLGFGSFSRSGLVFMEFNLGIGHVLISKIGGEDWKRDHYLNVRPSHH